MEWKLLAQPKCARPTESASALLQNYTSLQRCILQVLQRYAIDLDTSEVQRREGGAVPRVKRLQKWDDEAIDQRRLQQVRIAVELQLELQPADPGAPAVATPAYRS